MGGMFWLAVGTFIQPKDNLWVELVSFIILGLVMGCVDGIGPTILDEVADRKFNNTGMIFVIENIAVQLGFVVGPIFGQAINQHFGFTASQMVNGIGVLIVLAFYASDRFGGPGTLPPVGSDEDHDPIDNVLDSNRSLRLDEPLLATL